MHETTVSSSVQSIGIATAMTNTSSATSSQRSTGPSLVIPVLWSFALSLALIWPATAEVLLVTPSGGPAFDENGRKLADSSFAYGAPVFSQAKPGDVIQLAADKPDALETTIFVGPVVIAQKGSATSAPIVL